MKWKKLNGCDKCWSISMDRLIKYKLLISEEWYTLVSRIAAHVLQFFFRKFCPYFRSIRDYAFNNFQKKFRKYSNKIQFHSNSYAFIRNPSTLCLYEIFEMVNPLLLFHTVPQYESLEYLPCLNFVTVRMQIATKVY